MENRDENIVIAEGYEVLTAIENYDEFKVSLNYQNLLVKPTHLKVMFTSSIKSSYNQSEETNAITTVSKATATEAISTGSELYLDNIQLNYE
ncbi:MAG: hypothetical protein LIP01_11065 [Tannerellaceae bacterium]|nr:hypothetical protein [Tannerellaceae bacterium]